jgi:undecaprenyl-diphosphatase
VTTQPGQASRRLFLYALICFALVIALGFAVNAGMTKDYDRSLLKAVALRQGTSPDAAIAAAGWATWLGDAARRSLAVVVGAIWLLLKKRTRAAIAFVVFPALAGVTCSIVKEAFARPRPALVPHLDQVTNLSFPSGHAANIVAIAVLVAWVIPVRRRVLWRVAAIGLAIVVGLSRLSLGVHWPSDVVGGWIWGFGWVLIALGTIRTLEGASE